MGGVVAGAAVVVDEAARGQVADEEAPVGAALGLGDVGVVVDGEEQEGAAGEAEGGDDVGERGRVGEVGDEEGHGRRHEEDVVAVAVAGEGGGEAAEVEVDEAVVQEVGPAQDGQVGADEGGVAVGEDAIVGAATGGGGCHESLLPICFLTSDE